MKVFGNAIIVTMNDQKEIFSPGYLCVEGDRIVELGPMDDCHYPYEDLDGSIIMPGLINGHTHLSLVYLRSMADDMGNRLRRFLFPMESQHYDLPTMESGAAYGAYESLLNGTTTIVDMYYEAKALARIYEAIGIRAFVGQTIIGDHTLAKDVDEAYLIDFIESYKDHSMVKPFLAPHAPYSIDDHDIDLINKLSEGYDVIKMMHIAEMDFEMDQYKPKTPFEVMEEKGLIDHNFIGIHGIHTQAKDFEILKRNGAGMVCCPGANMKAGKGIPDIWGFIDKGIPTMLGTDGPVSGNTLDLMSVMKLTGYAQKTLYRNRELLPADQILALATSKAAQVLKMDHVGSLSEGYQADLVFIDTKSLNINPIYDVYSTIVYGLQTQNIMRVVVAGKILVDDHKIIDTSGFDCVKEAFSERVKRFQEIYADLNV